MKVKLVVTGGAGFIGSNLIRALNEKGETDILVVDELGTGEKWKNLRGLLFQDYIGKQEFREWVRAGALSGVEAVFHLGACSSTDEPDASYLAENNYRYTRELCEWSLGHAVRFIYASSGATYGDGFHGYSDADENTPRLRPLNMYGYSKHMFDMWALSSGALEHIAGLKYFNVYGPGEDHKGDMRSVAHKAYGQIIESGEVKLFRSYRSDYKDGEQLRDFIYVRDAVDVTLHFHRNPEVSGIFNCGTGNARTWNDMANAVFSALGKKPRIQYIDMPETLRDKYQYRTEADISKLRSNGYDKPFTSLEDGIRDYVKNHLANG